MTTHCATACQGHKYRYGDKEVLAMESGIVIQVREIDHTAKHYSIDDLKEIKETYKLKLKELKNLVK